MKKTQLLHYFNKYRPNLVPIALYFFGFFIILQILIPQFSQFQVVKKELNDVKDDISLLEGSLETLSSLDESSLDDTLSELERALPFDQDATLAISSFNTAALRSDVEIVGYVVSPGTIYKKSIEKEESVSSRNDEVPYLEIELRVTADRIEDIVAFVTSLENLAPISEITEFSAKDTTGSFSLKFFYHPLNREAIAQRDTVAPLKATDIEVIEKIKSFSQ